MGTHMIPPPQPPPQYISVKQVNKFQQQQQHDDKATEISAVNTSGFIMGRRNEQSSLWSCNNNGQIKNVFSKRRIGRDTVVFEPATNTYATNEADNNSYTCCLSTNLIPIEYINHTSDVYLYSDAYESLEIFSIISGDT